MVELDVHPTTDSHFVVFHDWTLDCRTDGRGVTREHTLAELKALDIGYGYTPDGGKTYPFRGKGIGLMPSLSEVLTAFPQKAFLINVKSNDADEGAQLADMLAQLPNERLERIMVYGGDQPIQALRQRLPRLRTMSRETLKSCFLRYVAAGWSGYVPHPCRNTLLLVPTNVAPWLWGWPHVFQRRLTQYNTVIYAVAPYNGGEFSSGINSPDQLNLLSKGLCWRDLDRPHRHHRQAACKLTSLESIRRQIQWRGGNLKSLQDAVKRPLNAFACWPRLIRIPPLAYGNPVCATEKSGRITCCTSIDAGL